MQQKKEQAILRDQLHLKKEKKQAHVRRQLESFSAMLAEFSRVPLDDHPCIELRVVVHLERFGI